MARLRFANRHRVCGTVGLLVEEFSSNGKMCLNRLCQPRGQAQSDTDSFGQVLLRQDPDADFLGLGAPGAGENARLVLERSAGAGAEPCAAERRRRRGR